MINIFIALLFMIFSYSLFSFSYSIQGINRLVINAPKTIFEYAVVIDEKENVYLQQEDLKKRYLIYLDDAIKKYVNEYDISFRFYDPISGGLCDEKCEGVEVTVESYIAFSYTYSRTMFYQINEVHHG